MAETVVFGNAREMRLAGVVLVLSLLACRKPSKPSAATPGCAANLQKKRVVATPGASASELQVAMAPQDLRVLFRADDWKMVRLAPTEETTSTKSLLAITSLADAVVHVEEREIDAKYFHHGNWRGTANLGTFPDEIVLGGREHDWMGFATGQDRYCRSEVCMVVHSKDGKHEYADARVGYSAVFFRADRKPVTVYQQKCENMPKPSSHFEKTDGVCKEPFEKRPRSPSIAVGVKRALVTFRVGDELVMQMVSMEGELLGPRRTLIKHPVGRAAVAANGAGFDVVVATENGDLSFAHIEGDQPVQLERVGNGTAPALASTLNGRVVAFIAGDGTLRFAWTHDKPTEPTTVIAKDARSPAVVFDGQAGWLGWLEGDAVAIAPIECH